jgi:uncharacterized protein YukE
MRPTCVFAPCDLTNLSGTVRYDWRSAGHTIQMAKPLRLDADVMESESRQFAQLDVAIADVAAQLRKQWQRLHAGWISYARQPVDDVFGSTSADLARASAMFAQIQLALQLTQDSVAGQDARSAASIAGRRNPSTTAAATGAASAVARAADPGPISTAGVRSADALAHFADADRARFGSVLGHVPLTPHKTTVFDAPGVRIAARGGWSPLSDRPNSTLKLVEARPGNPATLTLETAYVGAIDIGMLGFRNGRTQFAGNPANAGISQQLPDGRWVITRLWNAAAGHGAATYELELYDARGNWFSTEQVVVEVLRSRVLPEPLPRIPRFDAGIPERNMPQPTPAREMDGIPERNMPPVNEVWPGDPPV